MITRHICNEVILILCFVCFLRVIWLSVKKRHSILDLICNFEHILSTKHGHIIWVALELYARFGHAFYRNMHFSNSRNAHFSKISRFAWSITCLFRAGSHMRGVGTPPPQLEMLNFCVVYNARTALINF